MAALKQCELCGMVFEAEHGNSRQCPECAKYIKGTMGHRFRYDNPRHPELYEQALAKRNYARYKDTIVAEGYADRQRAKTLAAIPKIDTTL